MMQEELISQNMVEAGLTQDDLAYYSDVSAGTISNGLRGKGFSNTAFVKLDATLQKFLRIRRILTDVPLNFKDIRRTKILLQRLENDEPLISATAALRPSQLAVPTPSTPPAPPSEETSWELMHELINGDQEVVCSVRGWSKAEYYLQLSKAVAQFKKLNTELAAARADRAQLLK